MRKWIKYAIPAVLLSQSLNVYAVAPGFYMGIMGGPATNNGKTEQVQVLPAPTALSPQANTAPADPKSTQFGSRFFLGYKFNQYASFEGGFVYFSGINYILKTNQQPAGGTTARVRGIDVVGKVDYSIPNSFGIFGKAGVGEMYITTPGGLNVTNYSSTSSKTTGSNTYSSKVAPVLGVGVSYDFNQNWVMDASWTRYFVGSPVNNMDLFGLALSYHFVDKYCGQFLCD